MKVLSKMELLKTIRKFFPIEYTNYINLSEKTSKLKIEAFISTRYFSVHMTQKKVQSIHLSESRMKVIN